MEWVSILLFAVALSLDGFGVGISYGMRGIKIPVSSLVVISLTSAGAISISMLGGHILARVISVEAAEIIGAVILIVVGGWIIYQATTGNKNGKKDGNKTADGLIDADLLKTRECELFKIRLKPLGIVIQIVKEPSRADMDDSGNISEKEAFFLGLALALDALGAGFGAAMTGIKPLVTPVLVGVTKFTLVGVGGLIGRRYAANWIGDKAATIPGWVLIVLGVIRVMKL